MLLRPHHIYCFHFSSVSFSDPERGRKYEEARSKIEALFKSGKGDVHVNEGPDLLCGACPYFDGQACSHPNGNENAVRKWDARILDGLHLEYGQVIKVTELKSLIKQNAPLSFCLNRCPHYKDNRCNPQKIPEYMK